MKTKIYAFALAIVALSVTSCTKDDNDPTPVISTKVDRTDTITLGASYVNDIYYSFKNGVIAEVPRANWDIAFGVPVRSSSILINSSAGATLKAYPSTFTTWVSNTTLDTTGYKTWDFLYNSDTTWEDGAFSRNATGFPNYGWCIYDYSSTHNLTGNAIYVIKLRNGDFKKIFIDKKLSALQKYTFHYANIDGTDEHTVNEIDASTSKANYIYYSLQDNGIVADREPDASTWDILFTKWIDNSMVYPVTGALQNNGITAIKKTADDPSTITYSDDQFCSKINTIGADWKTINMSTYQYDIPTNRYYIVKDKNNIVYRINFKSFAGSSTGVLSFYIKQL